VKKTIQKSSRVLKAVFRFRIPDLYQWITDPNPALDPDLVLFFTRGFQDANKRISFIVRELKEKIIYRQKKEKEDSPKI
jgi:hypothetical protein